MFNLSLSNERSFNHGLLITSITVVWCQMIDFSIRAFSVLLIHSIFDVGPRIALRGKVNVSLISGLRIIDVILPIGRGQRQLILGDRNTGKTSIVVCMLMICNKNKRSTNLWVNVKKEGINRMWK